MTNQPNNGGAPGNESGERLHTTEVVAREQRAMARWNADDATLVEVLDGVQAALKASTDLAGERLASLWDPTTQSYAPRAEADVLHNIINQNVIAALRLRRAQRMAKKDTPVRGS